MCIFLSAQLSYMRCAVTQCAIRNNLLTPTFTLTDNKLTAIVSVAINAMPWCSFCLVNGRPSVVDNR